MVRIGESTTVSLEEIDGAVVRHFRLDPKLFRVHRRRVGPAKGAGVELAAWPRNLGLIMMGSTVWWYC
jgi:hypothetical protein